MVILVWHSKKPMLAGVGRYYTGGSRGLAWNLASALHCSHTFGQLPEGTHPFPSTHSPERMCTPELWGGGNLCTIAVPSFHGNQAGSESSGSEAVWWGDGWNRDVDVSQMCHLHIVFSSLSASEVTHTHTSNCSFLIWCQVPKQRASGKCILISFILPMWTKTGGGDWKIPSTKDTWCSLVGFLYFIHISPQRAHQGTCINFVSAASCGLRTGNGESALPRGLGMSALGEGESCHS